MTGIYYDPSLRRICLVAATPGEGWVFVTHNLSAGVNQCRRIMREWMGTEELWTVDWSAIDAPATRSA